MNFKAYPLYVGNDIDKKEFEGYGDYVELTADGGNAAWSVSDDTILKFREISGGKATVQAVRTGFADVYADLPDGTREICHVSVIDNYSRRTVERIEFNIDTLRLAPGMSADIIPILYPKDIYGNGILNASVAYTSSDERVAAVDNGKVKAIGSGSAVIRAVSADVEREAEFKVIVSENTVCSEITAENGDIISVSTGEAVQLKAKSNSEIVWRSDNSYIADVDRNGVVTAYSNSKVQVLSDDGVKVTEKQGTVKIYATAAEGGTVKVFELAVSDAPIAVHSIFINKKEAVIPSGERAELTAVITPASVMEKRVRWSSSNSEVLTVEEADNTIDGANRAVLTAHKPGEAVIAAEYGGKRDICKITVTAERVKVTRISADLEKEIDIDEVRRLSASVNSDAADKRIMWVGENEDIATVDRDGNVMGYKHGTIKAYAFALDSVTEEQLEELKLIKREGKRRFTAEEISGYLNTYAVCKITVRESSPYLRNLHVAEETVTHNSVNLLWNSASKMDMPEFGRYIVECDGASIAEVNTLGYTARGLESGKSYKFSVAAVDKNGTELARAEVSVTTKAEPKIINVLDYGARGDGKTLDTHAIQRAIDDCPENGMVYLPEGHIFRSGALFLKSDMIFKVDGIILGSTDPKDYPRIITRWEGWRKLPMTAGEWQNSENNPERPYMLTNDYQHASLINLGTYYEGENGVSSPCNVRNVCICGEGQINANGFALAYNEGPNWKHKDMPGFYLAKPPVQNPGMRGRTLAMNNAERVYIKDIQIAYSPSWTTHFIFCNEVTFDNVSVISQGHGDAGYGSDLHNCIHIFNGDGIDPEDCTYVNIFNTYFRTGDDTVTLKAGRNREGNELDKPNAYIRVTDCLCSWSLGGFGIGSEDASGAHDILYQNLRVKDGEIFGFWFKTCPVRGSLTENITMRDCHAEGVRAVLVFSHEYSKSGKANPAKYTPIHRYFTIENISGCGSEYSMRFNGLKPGSIEHITIRGASFTGAKEIDITRCAEDAVRFID